MKLQTDAPNAQCARPQEVTSHEQERDVRQQRQEVLRFFLNPAHKDDGRRILGKSLNAQEREEDW